jgi:hypothetical protein
MPNVKGMKLDLAKSDIKSAGFDGDVEVLGGGAFGVIVESNWIVCDQQPGVGTAMKDAPRLTVDRSCGGGSSPSPTPTSSSEPTQPSSPEPSATETSAVSYKYSGPKYEVVTVDSAAGMGVLDQYWVYTKKLNYSTDAYKAQLKLLIADVARAAGTDKLIVQIVTDKEIAEAEAISTYKDFVAVHGSDYAVNTIPKKEKTGWVASYTGGIDSDAGELSDSETAFVIDWFAAGDKPTSERWKPVLTG